MFGNTNTTDLMLPILLDMANLVRRAIRPGKETREVKQPPILRRSYTEDQTLDYDYFDVGVEPAPTPTKQELQRTRRIIPQNQKNTITISNTDKIKTVENSTTVHDDVSIYLNYLASLLWHVLSSLKETASRTRVERVPHMYVPP